MAVLLTVLRALVGSKKFISAIVGVLAVVGVRYLGLGEEQATEIGRELVAVFSALLVGQGLTDQGRERAKVEFLPSADSDDDTDEE